MKPNITSCNCIGPQDGRPLCPCAMSGVVERDGRWIRLEQDLGPTRPHYRLEDLVAGMTEENRHGEFPWGEP